jgi:hypothetical protein
MAFSTPTTTATATLESNRRCLEVPVYRRLDVILEPV